MKVKDVLDILIDNEHGYKGRVLFKFYDECGLFIGYIYKDTAMNYSYISHILHDMWESYIVLSTLHTADDLIEGDMTVLERTPL